MVLRVDLDMYGYQAAHLRVEYIHTPPEAHRDIEILVIFNISMQERLFLYLGVVRSNRALIATNATVLVKEKRASHPPCSQRVRPMPWGSLRFFICQRLHVAIVTVPY